MTLCYMAYNLVTGVAAISDVANHTLRLILDGSETVPTNSPSEVDSTNCPGLYQLALTAAESAALYIVLAGKSSTADVSIVPTEVAT